MKYFTKDLWLAANNLKDEDAYETADRQWQRNLRAYVRQMDKIKPRLSKQAARFFTSVSLHDGRLLSFCAGDGLEFDSRGGRRFDRNKRNTSVVLRAVDYEQEFLYTLKYTKVRKAVFDFPGDQPLFYLFAGDHIGDWGYDELTARGEEYLRHEILFASGSTILIEFKHFSYKRARTQLAPEWPPREGRVYFQ
jgi:hypothetical protein